MIEDQAQTEETTQAQAKGVWTIVSQVKSNRVVYVTDDAGYQPAMDGDWYYYSSHAGPLPPGMTLRNCWGWRFNGGVFSDARNPPAKSTAETLLDSNRKALLRVLKEKIDTVRKPFAPDCMQGAALRAHKLDEARRYLAQDTPAAAGAFVLLQSLSTARNTSVLEAARLVMAKAEEADAVYRETERFREQLKHAIQSATTQAQLLELRAWLLDHVYPALSDRFKYQVQNTEPIDLDKPVLEVHRVHEVARLKAQLREAINHKRAAFDSGYVRNDEIRKHKARLAQAVLAPGGRLPSGLDLELLQAYADARELTLDDAARGILGSVNAEAAVLAETEKSKDLMLARIDTVRSLRDIKELEGAIEALCAPQSQP